jgi:macrolide transport system ATP-binding/permease protein
MDLIRLENVTKTYHLGEIDVPVLKGVSLAIRRGEMLALMGASGSGKTTLLNILGCLDRPSSGSYCLDGQETIHMTPNQRAILRTSRIGFVFQSFNLLPRTSATQNVLMPLEYAPHRVRHHDSQHRVAALLRRVALADRSHHEPAQMSGGQQQRVAIARALVNRPALVLADEPTGNLDSKTSVEILEMFQQLNAEGITVILVTHDPKVAAFADRTIRMVDGRIVSDDAGPRQKKPLATNLSPATRAGSNGVQKTHLHDGHEAKPKHSPMHSLLPTTFRTALSALRRNKLRSALTALGVIIGVGAVIAMTEIGEGSKIALQKTIASMGTNNLLILPGAAMSGSVSFGAGTAQTLKPGDMDEILRQCPAVSEVAPFVWARAQVGYRNRNWIPRVIAGTTPSFLAVRDWENMEEGDAFTERDVRSGAKICLLGATLKRELFPDESAVGKEVRIQNVSFRVVGVLSAKGANMMGQDQDDIVLAPWTTVKFRVNASGAGSTWQTTAAQSAAAAINSLNNLYPPATPLYPLPSITEAIDTPQAIRRVSVDMMIAKAVSPEQIPEAIEQISGLLRERHNLPSDRDNDFEIRDMTELSRTMSSASALIRALLLVVAAISLIVGGVGIMNIMLVSVTERTREIGLRMAVGARRHHILRQFLFEAVLLCLAGGMMGIAVGRGVSIIVRSVERWPTAPSLPAILTAVLVSAGVGVVFGFYPAWKASCLDPIEALRYE